MLMRINHHSGVIMTRYRSHTETQLAKINATLTKLLAAQLETNRLLAANGSTERSTERSGALRARSLAEVFAPVASGQPGPTAPDSGGNNAGAGFTQITLDDLLGESKEPDPDVWADLGYSRGNN